MLCPVKLQRLNPRPFHELLAFISNFRVSTMASISWKWNCKGPSPDLPPPSECNLCGSPGVLNKRCLCKSCATLRILSNYNSPPWDSALKSPKTTFQDNAMSYKSGMQLYSEGILDLHKYSISCSLLEKPLADILRILEHDYCFVTT